MARRQCELRTALHLPATNHAPPCDGTTRWHCERRDGWGHERWPALHPGEMAGGMSGGLPFIPMMATRLSSSGRWGDGGSTTMGLGEEDWGRMRDAGLGRDGRRLGFLTVAVSVLYVSVKKNGRPRFVARKIRWLSCEDRCEAPYGGHHIYLQIS
jgi:hypothetical protein